MEQVGPQAAVGWLGLFVGRLVVGWLFLGWVHEYLAADGSRDRSAKDDRR